MLLKHADVAECAVVGLPDEERGQIVKAFVVLRDASKASDALVKELQDFVKNKIESSSSFSPQKIFSFILSSCFCKLFSLNSMVSFFSDSSFSRSFFVDFMSIGPTAL